MFPDDIKRVALVAIENSEFKTLYYLIHNLSGWMESPDKDTASAAIAIGNALSKTKEYNTDIDVVKKVHYLYSYAVRTIDYFKAEAGIA